MKETGLNHNPFIEYLYTLKEDRAALADLRRGLAKKPGTESCMYPYVVRWLSADCPRQKEAVYYLVAALFGLHPSIAEEGNMGAHFRRAAEKEGESQEAAERRFRGLLAAHPEDMPFHLRQAVSYLKSKEIPICWQQLLADLIYWGHPDKYAQRRWAGSYWAYQAKTENTEEQGE